MMAFDKERARSRLAEIAARAGIFGNRKEIELALLARSRGFGGKGPLATEREREEIRALIVESNLPLAVAAARKARNEYSAYRLDVEDLFSACAEAVCRALDTYDFSRGEGDFRASFSSVAVWEIKTALWREICASVPGAGAPKDYFSLRGKRSRGRDMSEAEKRKLSALDAVFESLLHNSADDDDFQETSSCCSDGEAETEEYMFRKEVASAVCESLAATDKAAREVFLARWGMNVPDEAGAEMRSVRPGGVQDVRGRLGLGPSAYEDAMRRAVHTLRSSTRLRRLLESA